MEDWLEQAVWSCEPWLGVPLLCGGVYMLWRVEKGLLDSLASGTSRGPSRSRMNGFGADPTSTSSLTPVVCATPAPPPSDMPLPREAEEGEEELNSTSCFETIDLFSTWLPAFPLLRLFSALETPFSPLGFLCVSPSLLSRY